MNCNAHAKHWILPAIFIPALLIGLATPVAAGEESAAQPAATKPHEASADDWKKKAVLGLGAGLAIGLAALGTGYAQARIGAAGVAAIAENPKNTGIVIMLVAIPETVAILGFVIAYLLVS